MTQVNTCLKRVFTIFNIFFAIIGLLIIGLALLCQVTIGIHEDKYFHHGLLVFYIVGAVTLVIAILGAYGAHKERLVPLIIFVVCMVMGSLLMLKVGVPTAAAHSQLSNIMEQRLKAFLPLDQASSEDQEEVNLVQSELHCCGLFHYSDWDDNIPDTCLCNPEEQQEEGLCQTVTSKRLQTKSIYAEPCFPIILHYTQLLLDIVLGIVFSLLALALLGMILSSIIIHQMRYPTNPETPAAVPAVFASVPSVFFAAPPKYQELHNPPSY